MRLLDINARPQESYPTPDEADAEAIRAYPAVGKMVSARLPSGIQYAHENDAAWEILKETLSPSEYDALRAATKRA